MLHYSNFNQLADAIHWSLQHNYNVRHVLHYLDDFFTAGSPGSTECTDNLQSMLSLCTTINARGNVEVYMCKVTAAIYLNYSD